ncbi:MAG: peptidoglycan-binding protein [Segetibacter sp.]|jgi:hypothetical protein|nr:peptidoglycan-binding protein [Segetibacter sp.]
MNYPNRIIKKGEQDSSIILAIQQKLTENGCGTFDGLGSYGPKTLAAVKLFQSLHTDQLGNPLKIDGEVGSLTWAALFGIETVVKQVIPETGISKEALKIAKDTVGVMEKPAGSNSGPEVNEFLSSVNCPPGSFWCASFTYWCFKKASEKLGVPNPACKTAGCLFHWKNTSGTKIPTAEAINNPSLIKPGNIFIMDHGKGMGHTGLVEKVEGGIIHTIEGNSNPGGSRNGIGVFELRRKISSINKGFIAYS